MSNVTTKSDNEKYFALELMLTFYFYNIDINVDWKSNIKYFTES